MPVYNPGQEGVELHSLPSKLEPKETVWFIGDEGNQQLATESREKTS